MAAEYHGETASLVEKKLRLKRTNSSGVKFKSADDCPGFEFDPIFGFQGKCKVCKFSKAEHPNDPLSKLRLKKKERENRRLSRAVRLSQRLRKGPSPALPVDLHKHHQAQKPVEDEEVRAKDASKEASRKSRERSFSEEESSSGSDRSLTDSEKKEDHVDEENSIKTMVSDLASSMFSKVGFAWTYLTEKKDQPQPQPTADSDEDTSSSDDEEEKDKEITKTEEQPKRRSSKRTSFRNSLRNSISSVVSRKSRASHTGAELPIIEEEDDEETTDKRTSVRSNSSQSDQKESAEVSRSVQGSPKRSTRERFPEPFASETESEEEIVSSRVSKRSSSKQISKRSSVAKDEPFSSDINRLSRRSSSKRSSSRSAREEDNSGSRLSKVSSSSRKSASRQAEDLSDDDRRKSGARQSTRSTSSKKSARKSVRDEESDLTSSESESEKEIQRSSYKSSRNSSKRLSKSNDTIVVSTIPPLCSEEEPEEERSSSRLSSRSSKRASKRDTMEGEEENGGKNSALGTVTRALSKRFSQKSKTSSSSAGESSISRIDEGDDTSDSDSDKDDTEWTKAQAQYVHDKSSQDMNERRSAGVAAATSYNSDSEMDEEEDTISIPDIDYKSWVGRKCRALYAQNDCFYPATIIDFIDCDSDEGVSFTVKFNGGTIQEDTSRLDIQLVDEDDDTGVDVVSYDESPRSVNIWEAAKNGDLLGVEYYIKKGVNVDEPDPNSASAKTPLLLACEYGEMSIAKRLMQAGAEDYDGEAYVIANEDIRKMLKHFGFGKTKINAKIKFTDSGDPIGVVRERKHLSADAAASHSRNSAFENSRRGQSLPPNAVDAPSSSSPRTPTRQSTGLKKLLCLAGKK